MQDFLFGFAFRALRTAAGLSDCQGHQAKRSALHPQLSLRRLAFDEDFRHFFIRQVDSLVSGALRPTLRSFLSRAPPTARLSRAPSRVQRPSCSAARLAKAWLCRRLVRFGRASRLTRLHVTRSLRLSIISFLAPRRLPDIQRRRPENRALRAIQLGMRRLDFVKNCRHF